MVVIMVLCYQVSYHEVESFNGDSNSLFVEKAGPLLLESLLPGRNYSISVQAVSNGVDSNETSLYQATREYKLLVTVTWVQGYILTLPLMQSSGSLV
jgi:hypothetical protein